MKRSKRRKKSEKKKKAEIFDVEKSSRRQRRVVRESQRERTTVSFLFLFSLSLPHEGLLLFEGFLSKELKTAGCSFSLKKEKKRRKQKTNRRLLFQWTPKRSLARAPAVQLLLCCSARAREHRLQAVSWGASWARR